MSSRAPDFESPEFDNADILQADAYIDASEAFVDAQRHAEEQRAFETAALQFAISSCLNSCLDSLDLLYIPRESHPISDIAIAHDSWRQEEEPEPCSRDSWLRRAIPEGPNLTIHPSGSSLACNSQITLEHSVGGTSKGSRPLSGASIAQRAAWACTAATADAAGTVAAGSSSHRRILVSRSSGWAGGATDRVAPVSSTAETSVKDAASNSSATQQQQKQLAGKQPAQRQHDAQDRLRQELQVRRQQEAVAKEMKQKDEQARAALIAMQKELKGKDYTYNSSGKLVLLSKINPDSLPAPPGPQFRVHTAATDAYAAGAASGAKQGSTARNLLGGSTSKSGTAGAGAAQSSSGVKSRNSKVAAVPASDFKQTASQTQPAVLETLRPAAGVVLRAGAAAKQGPKRESMGQTRAQYQLQAKAQNLQATRIVAGNSNTAGVRASSGVGTAGMRAFSASSVASNASMAGGANGRLTPQRAAAVAALNGRASPALSGAASVPTAVASEWSTPTPEFSEAAGVAAPAARSSRIGSAVSASVPTAVQRAPSPDVNLVLVSAADWGMAGSSSGYLTPPDSMQTLHKPSNKQIKEEFGRTTFLPKVRSPIQTLKPPKTLPGNTATAGKLQAARGTAQ